MSSTSFSKAAATLLQRGMVRTNAAVSRPSPSLLFFPGLTSRPWWPQETFPWLQRFADDKVRQDLCQEFDEMKAKLSSGDYSLQANEHTLHKGQGEWKWQSLMQKGSITPQAGLLAPKTTSMLMETPLMTSVPFGYAFFSEMSPGTHIQPHFGPTNLRLRIHVPLRMPAGNSDASRCGIRVGRETKTWELGQPLLFDDAFEHETWNRHGEEESKDATKKTAVTTLTEEEKTAKTRLILLFDVWHPELEREEIEGLVALFDEARQKGWIK